MPQHPKDDGDEDRTEKRGLLYNIIGGILIAGCCWSLGYGYSQSTLSATVARVNLSVDHIREIQQADRRAFEDADSRLTKDIAASRETSSEHMKSVVSLVEKMTQQNQELIAFLRAMSAARP